MSASPTAAREGFGMNVKTLCLGVLTMGDASGYEIKKKLEGSFRRFYDASFGSIYPALGRLQEAGHVTCVEMPQQGRPDKKIYSLTAEGRTSLVEELSAPLGPDRIRSEFMASMIFAHLIAPERVHESVETRLADYRDSIDKLAAVETDRLTPGSRFVLGWGLAMYQAGLAYLEGNRHLVEDVARADTEAAE